jgi:MoaA/NifB/PqqE/SkfB family radical SAM enzyme
MPLDEAMNFLAAAGELNPPSLLLSGGEPLTHPNFFQLLDRAADCSLRVSLSTNGTLIDPEAARFLSGRIGYAGVSLDGPREVHDAFRGAAGAFDKALYGIANLKEAGVRVGLRFTMARPLLPYLPSVMKIAEDLGVDRICLYHFIPSGRGGGDLSPAREDVREALFRLFQWVSQGSKTPREVLTVGNFADGILLYLWLAGRKDRRAAGVLDLISRQSSKNCKRGILSVRWDGAVFADQFSWRLGALGRWPDMGKVAPVADHRPGGRCERCRWLALCRGNMRARAADNGEDTGCVLLDGETL